MRELRKVVFGACCGLGALGGVWTGIWASPELDRRGSIGEDLGAC